MKILNKHIKLLVVLFFTCGAIIYPDYSNAQCNFVANSCVPNLHPFTSDGQYYHSLLLEDETAEFKTTFYAGEEYRIVACGKDGMGGISYTLLDANYNLIFNNADYDNAGYWDFKFNSTNDYYIQAKLAPGSGSGCAVILIGFDCHCGD